jgi:hypothetical protein
MRANQRSVRRNMQCDGPGSLVPRSSPEAIRGKRFVLPSDQAEIDAWHPHIVDLHQYWRGLRSQRSGALPARRSLDPAAMPRQALAHVWILDWHADPPRLRFRLLGTKLVEFFGRELAGKWVDEVFPEIAGNHPVLLRHQMVAGTRTPHWRKGPPQVEHNYVSLIESIALPLAADGEHVDGFLMQSRFYRRDGGEA